MSDRESRRSSESSGRKRRRSVESASSDTGSERRTQNERIGQLEMLLKQVLEESARTRADQSSQPAERPRTSKTRPGDEGLIPYFDPMANEMTVEQWVRNVDVLAKKFGWDDCSILRLISMRLKGNARRWFDGRRCVETSWRQTKVTIVQTFHKPLPFAMLLEQAVAYTAKPGQHLGDYCFEKLRKFRKLNIDFPEEYLVDVVIHGVKDDNTARVIRAAKLVEVNDLHNHMQTLGRLPGADSVRGEVPKRRDVAIGTSYRNQYPSTAYSSEARRERATGSGAPASGVRVTEGDSRAESSDSRVTSGEVRRIKCYNCGGIGHFARECTKPRRRYTGYKNGEHEDARSSRAQEVVTVGVNSGQPPNKYATKVCVNNYKVQGLVDTGSARTLIRKSVANHLELRVEIGPTVMLRGFAGQTEVTSERARISLKVQQATVILNALVVPKEHIDYDVIVGRDYLDADDIVVIKVGDSLLIKQTAPKRINEDLAVAVYVCDASAEEMCIGDIGIDARRKCKALLSEFADCVSTSLNNLGKTSIVQMGIKCMTEEPVVHRPYRLPEVEKKVIRGMIAELLDSGIIRESDSPYASPVLLVKKKTGDYRMCIDYRKLNAITIKDKYPLPLIEDQIDKLGGYRYFTGLDLASGYYQIPLDEDAIKKTAFVVPDGHYEFLRMPFGLANAPAVFQRMINKALGSLKNSVAFPYMDDIIIPSRTVTEGIQRLRTVLETLRSCNLTLKLSKCSFLANKIEYLGREISGEGVRPGERKVEAIVKMTDPRTVKQVRQFLGLANYFRKFIKNFATVVEPLTQLTRKDVAWRWTESQRNAVDVIKKSLTTRPILAIFDPTKVTELHTDASSLGVGAILIQKRGSEIAVVAYFSKQLTRDQRCYHSYELETMAVVLALRHFRVYLLGLRFKVVTDCNALRTTFSRRDLLPRIGRWWLEVQDFAFDIEYRAGTKMAHVDALSRNPVMTLEVCNVDITEADWLLAAQLQDEQLSRIGRILSDGRKTDETKHYFKEYTMRNGKIHRRLENGTTAWVVPRNARMQICRLCHDDAGHLGVEKTVERIGRNYWFANMRRFVKKYVSACLSCAYYKDAAKKKQGKLHCIEKTPVPFHTVHVDHVGPFETSRRRNRYLLVIVDGFTKFTVIEPVKSQKTRHTVRVLLDLICLFGCPTRLISDRGTAFTSHTFKVFCATYGIKHVLNAVATPRANGQCERYNRTIVNALAATAAGKDSNEWDQDVKKVQSALNTMHNKSINTTPMEALIGCNVKSAAEAHLLSSLTDEVDRLDLLELRETIAQHVTKDQQKQKERYDKARREAQQYREGDLVLVRVTSEPSIGTSRKLMPKFKGPFRVRKVLYNDRYEVEDLREGKKRINTVTATDHMKPWVTVQTEGQE